ncbi:MAG TPA: hypothetical protein PL009_06875, partial [Flavipsychrobacter sp.]|nr:hypothetical protein [Flavipsychrobacter sp.]
MKKAFIVLLVLGSAATQSFGQDKAPKNNAPFYLRIGGTYAFSHAGQTAVGGAYINGSYSSDASYSGGQTSTFSETYDLKKASFGNGITAVVACGAMLHKHIGVELAVSIGITAKKYTYSYVDNETGSSPTYTYKFTQQTTMYQRTPILLMPSVVLQSGGEKLNVYSRMGLALPVAGKFIMERRITENHSNNPSTIGA